MTIREVRISKGLSQKELSYMTGVSIPMLSLIENGKREGTFKVLKAIGKALELTPSQLGEIFFS